MQPRSLIRPGLLFIALAGAALFVFAACGDDKKDNEPAATSTQAAASNTPVGGEIDISGVTELEDGTLSIGSDIAYAPMEFYQEGTETADGLDVDLANAIAAVLGVDVEFINTGFDGIIPALNTEDFDIIMSAMTIDDERSAQVDFVPYLNVGTGILVPAGNPNNIEDENDLCGLTVAVQLGTVQEKLIDGLNDTCDEPIDKLTFDTNPLAVEELRTGGADANLSDYPVAYLDAQESGGDLEVLDTNVEPQPYGIAVRKGDTALADVLEQALQVVISDGTYQDLLDKWDLATTALPRD